MTNELNPQKLNVFEAEVKKLVNTLSIDNDLNTPDYLLAAFLTNALCIYNNQRESIDTEPRTMHNSNQWQQLELDL